MNSDSLKHVLREFAEREAVAMAAGARLLPKARGVLLYHEHAPDTATRFPEGQPAWRWRLEQGKENPSHEV